MEIAMLTIGFIVGIGVGLLAGALCNSIGNVNKKHDRDDWK